MLLLRIIPSLLSKNSVCLHNYDELCYFQKNPESLQLHWVKVWRLSEFWKKQYTLRNYAAITDTSVGLALKVNKRVLTFCFGKSLE